MEDARSSAVGHRNAPHRTSGTSAQRRDASEEGQGREREVNGLTLFSGVASIAFFIVFCSSFSLPQNPNKEKSVKVGDVLMADNSCPMTDADDLNGKIWNPFVSIYEVVEVKDDNALVVWKYLKLDGTSGMIKSWEKISDLETSYYRKIKKQP